MLELSVSLLVNQSDETLFPSKELNDSDIGKNLIGGVDTSIGSRKNELLNLGKLSRDIHVDGKQEDHHADTGN